MGQKGSKNYKTSVDIWSVGCVFAEMLLKRPVFGGVNPQEQLDLIFGFLGTPTKSEWPDLCALASNNVVNGF